MSILIKGMEMPCACVFCELYDGDLYWCRGAKKEVPYSPADKRAKFCPLVPVPPHGDLIDRDAVVETAMPYCPDDDGSCTKADADLRDLLDEIEGLPTIIPAEEVE